MTASSVRLASRRPNGTQRATRRSNASGARRLRVRGAEHDVRRQTEAKLRALHAVTLMRRGQSFTAASKAAGTTTKTVRRYARQALRRRDGRYIALPHDQLRRPIKVLTERGMVVLDIPNSKTSSRISGYWNAVHLYLRTGDRRALAAYTGKRFRAQGQFFPFITDLRVLDRLAQAGQVSFEDLYEGAA